jgi:DNA-binding transcriptional ArsR family regulator
VRSALPVVPGEVEFVRELGRAACLLSPLRLEILERAREPRSATELAAELGLARQKVNYHVRELARGAFLRRAERRRRRSFYEQRYVASARAYLLAPGILGPLEADPSAVRGRIGPAYLLALGARMQRELATAAGEASAQGKLLPTLALDAELRFESAEAEQAFARALQRAVLDAIQTHTSPARLADGTPGPGRPFRLVLGCHPIPATEERP